MANYGLSNFKFFLSSNFVFCKKGSGGQVVEFRDIRELRQVNCVPLRRTPILFTSHCGISLSSEDALEGVYLARSNWDEFLLKIPMVFQVTRNHSLAWQQNSIRNCCPVEFSNSFKILTLFYFSQTAGRKYRE